MLGSLQVFQTVLSQIQHGNARRKVVADEREGSVCKEDLTSMPGGEKASHAVERRADIVIPALLGCAAM
jgi:hypothetical protein